MNILPVKSLSYCRWRTEYIAGEALHEYIAGEGLNILPVKSLSYCRWRTKYIAVEVLIILSVKDWIYCRWSPVDIAGEGLQNLDILGTYSLWAQRALYRATTVGSWDFGFFFVIQKDQPNLGILCIKQGEVKTYILIRIPEGNTRTLV